MQFTLRAVRHAPTVQTEMSLATARIHCINGDNNYNTEVLLQSKLGKTYFMQPKEHLLVKTACIDVNNWNNYILIQV